jgi:soluble lytic murein transglycosylase-like protein
VKAISVATARGWIDLWRGIFPGAPASVCLTLMEIESSFRPDAHAVPTAEALARGVPPAGAWGLLQLLPSTAADMVRKVKRTPDLPRVALEALETWDPARPECLTTPSLATLLGVAYLDRLAEKFGPGLEVLAGAFHNGPGFMRDFLEAGKRLPEDMPPKGRAYVLKARQVWPKYQLCDTPAAPSGVA